MSYSRRELYAMGEPFGECATERKVDGRYICGLGGGGGGSAPANTTQTVTQELPKWARPFAKEALGKASALANSPYQTYGGERIAQFTPLQKQAFEQAGGQQVAGQIGQATGLAGLAGTSSFRDQGTAQGFMSPFMQAVVEQQMSSAQRQADIAGERRKADFVRAGGFGGARQAIENAEAAKALASQKAELQAKGLQSAFEQAQNQFNQEQTQRLNAAQALGTLGTTQFGQEMDIMARRADLGGQQRAATQDILSQRYQDFLNQQRSPYDQLAFMTSMIRGTPMGGTTAQYQTSAAPSTASQLIGLGTAAAGAYGASKGAAAGGSVHSYAEGGGVGIGALMGNVGSLSDAQLGQMQEGEKPPLTAAIVAEEILRRQALREDMAQQQAMMAPPPNTTVVEDEFEQLAGLPGLPARNLDGMDTATMAGGGIVAFDQGGSTSPFGDLMRGAYGYLSSVGNPETNPRARLSELQSKRARAEQGFFEALTPAQKQVRQAEVAAIDQEIAAAQQGLSSLTRTIPVEGRDTAIMSDETRKRASARERTSATVPVVAEAQPTGKPGAEKPAPTGDGAGAGTAGLGSLLNMKDIYGKNRKDLEALGAEEKALAEQDLEAVRKDQEELGMRGADKKKRLDERAADIQKQKDLNPFMAMIDFGLATAAGESSNPFTNIAKGGMSGMKAYQEGLGRINRAQSDLDAKLSDLEDLQFSDAKANKTELRNAKNAVKKSEISTKKALAELGFKETDKLLDVWMETRKMQNQRDVAGIAASRSEKPFNYQDAYADYLKANAGKTDPVGRPLPVLSYADYIRQFALPQMAGTGTTSTLPKGAAVLPRN